MMWKFSKKLFLNDKNSNQRPKKKKDRRSAHSSDHVTENCSVSVDPINLNEYQESRAIKKFRENALAFETCTICFEENPNIATLCCGKVVHIACMVKWLNTKESCHQCRANMPLCSTSSSTLKTHTTLITPSTRLTTYTSLISPHRREEFPISTSLRTLFPDDFPTSSEDLLPWSTVPFQRPSTNTPTRRPRHRTRNPYSRHNPRRLLSESPALLRPPSRGRSRQAPPHRVRRRQVVSRARGNNNTLSSRISSGDEEYDNDSDLSWGDEGSDNDSVVQLTNGVYRGYTGQSSEHNRVVPSYL